MSSVLLFGANDGGTGAEVWLTNAAGTSATLVELFPGPTGSLGFFAGVSLGGELFFRANDGTVGAELFSSDGTVAGTGLFADIEFGPANSNALGFTSVQSITIDDTLYFSAYTSSEGYELWKTTVDGPPELVRDLNPGSGNSSPSWMVDLDGTLIFSAFDGRSGTELYRSDGTEAGTQRIADIYPGSNSSSPQMQDGNILNDMLFFGANDGTSGRELWKTDGTTAGTTLVRDINPGAGNSSPSITMTEFNGTLYFAADNGANGHELWRTDGSEGGTTLVRDINSGAGGSSISQITVLDDMMLFFANNGTNGRELWRSDGTSSGTALVRDINPGAGSASINNLAVADDLMYFSANDGTAGLELWVTDGTTAGTHMVQDVRVGSAGSNAVAMGVIDINVAPEAPTLSVNSISENFAPGTTVGTLAATDLDGDTLTFSLTNSANGQFTLNGNSLQTTAPLDFEAGATRSVTVQAADPGGGDLNPDLYHQRDRCGRDIGPAVKRHRRQ